MQTAIDISDKLVTMRAGLSLGEAEVLKSLLEANGVPVFLTAGHMAGLNYAVTTDLQVRVVDKVRADGLLNHVEAFPAPSKPTTNVDIETMCPTCGSFHLRPVVGAMNTAIPFLRIHASPSDRWFECYECGARFQDRLERFSSLGVALAWGAVLGAATLGVIWLLTWLSL